MIFVVEVCDAEATSIVSIHKTYEGALKSWNKKREELLKDFKRMKFWQVSRGWTHEYDSDYNKLIENLSCENPEEIDNYPHDTPYIRKFNLEE